MVLKKVTFMYVCVCDYKKSMQIYLSILVIRCRHKVSAFRVKPHCAEQNYTQQFITFEYLSVLCIKYCFLVGESLEERSCAYAFKEALNTSDAARTVERMRNGCKKMISAFQSFRKPPTAT